MSEGPVVTLIIPCFNQGQYLKECVASLYAQREQRWRAIVVNDASTDGTSAAACDAVKDGERVTVIHLAENRGRCLARNIAVERATTEAIFPLDADDLLHPEHLSLTVPRLLGDDDVGFVYTDYQCFGAETKLLRGAPFNAVTMYTERYVWAGSLLRRSAFERVGGYQDAFRDGSEDYDLFLSLVGAGYRGKYIPRALVRYRCHAESWSSSGVGGPARDFVASLRLAERHRQAFLEHGALGQFLSAAYEREAKRRFELGEVAAARQLARESLRYAPWRPRLWVQLLRQTAARG